MDTLLAWWKWGSLIAGMFGLIACGAIMAIGQRNRSNLAADGAASVLWVLTPGIRVTSAWPAARHAGACLP